MNLILMRHADAEDDNPDGDEARALTAKGRDQARRAGAALALFDARPERVLCSPRVRARQTAEMLLAGCGTGRIPLIDDALDCGCDWDSLLSRLDELGLGAGKGGKGWLAAVGHQPDMGEMLSEALEGGCVPLPFKKSALVALRWKPGRLMGVPEIAFAFGPDEAMTLTKAVK